MKQITLARVDDRLIHGEVVSVWTPSLSINRIVVIDDGVAADIKGFRQFICMALTFQWKKLFS